MDCAKLGTVLNWVPLWRLLVPSPESSMLCASNIVKPHSNIHVPYHLLCDTSWSQKPMSSLESLGLYLRSTVHAWCVRSSFLSSGWSCPAALLRKRTWQFFSSASGSQNRGWGNLVRNPCNLLPAFLGNWWRWNLTNVNANSTWTQQDPFGWNTSHLFKTCPVPHPPLLVTAESWSEGLCLLHSRHL